MQSVRKPGSESSEPHPSPRGLAPHSFQAGLLTRLHPRPAPSHAKYVAQWHVAGFVRPTAAGGCAGMSAVVENSLGHRLPVSPAPRSWSKEPKNGCKYTPNPPPRGRDLLQRKSTRRFPGGFPVSQAGQAFLAARRVFLGLALMCGCCSVFWNSSKGIGCASRNPWA